MKILLTLCLALGLSLPLFAQHKVHLTCQTTDPTAVRFHFYSGSVSGGPYNNQLDNSAVPVTTCAFDDTNESASQTVYYIFKSENAGGDLSPASPQVSLTLAPPPSAPTNPTAVQTQ